MNRWMNKHISRLSSCTCSEHLNSSSSSIIPYGLTFISTDSISKPASFFSKTWEWYIPWNIWEVVDFTRQYLSNSKEKCLSRSFVCIVREACEDPFRLNVDLFQFKETAPKIGCFCPKRKISFHASFLHVLVSNCHNVISFQMSAKPCQSSKSSDISDKENAPPLCSPPSVLTVNCSSAQLCYFRRLLTGRWWN